MSRYVLVEEIHESRGPLSDHGYGAPITFHYALRRRVTQELVFRFEHFADAISTIRRLDPAAASAADPRAGAARPDLSTPALDSGR